MDRNSIIGLLLIGAILIGFSIYNSPSDQEIAAAKRRQDSISVVQKEQEKQRQQKQLKQTVESAIAADSIPVVSDSVKNLIRKNEYGVFYAAAEGENKTITLENELLKVTVSNKGGRIVGVELKKYRTHDSLPLMLCKPENSGFGINIVSQNRIYSTDSLFFVSGSKPFEVKGNDSNSVSMRLYAGENKYLEYVYSLKGNSYMLDFTVNAVNMHDVIATNTSDLNIKWSLKGLSQEKSKENERNASTIYYKHLDEEVDYLSETKDEKESLQTKLKWVSFKQQYFTSVLISKEGFDKPTEIEVANNTESPAYTKNYTASLTLPYGHRPNETYPMSFYFGPNHYQTLKKYDIGLEKQVPLGWGIFGWVNRFCVIPVFNFLDSFNLNYGIIILLLTILIKIVLLPLTYKAYMTTAKMKVLKPEIDEINAKYEKKDPMEKQQAVMGLYRKAGVNPLGGCLPLLLQMPILIAMFRFFPASIELRQQSFLWATDLSSYDSIYDLGFNIPFYGDHISLFTLLMTVSTILYTRMNDQLTGGNAQMAQMKWIMYLMPIIFLGVFNNYASGLSYYYFLANMFTFGQQYLIKRLVNEDEIHRKIQEHKKKPSAAKSKFQQKLEDMQKQRQQLPRKK
jgi:YidC/Oxa1 family membrane protein insertase